MAKESFVTDLKRTPQLLLYGTPLLALIAFAGLNIYWVRDAYDGWRIFQIIILMMLGVYTLFIQPYSSSFSQQTGKILTVTLPVLCGLIIISCWQAEHSVRAIADAALYTLLAIAIWAQANLFRTNQKIASQIAAMLAVLPLLIVIFFTISLFRTINGNVDVDWHQSFANIRMLDDALLPCLFLLWQRPAWLAKNTFRQHFLNQTLTTGIYLTSTAYLLMLYYDGARAIFVSIIIGLIFIAIFRRDAWSSLRLPLSSLLSAALLFSTLKMITPNFIANPILRISSSNRDILWPKALHLWQENPILGVGGNNFVTSNPWFLNAHPHNIPLQFLSEWGITGLFILLLLIPIGIQFFRHRQILPTFALAAVVAIGIDALLSGIMVYPLSQMLTVWLFAWLMSLLPTLTLNSHIAVAHHPILRVTGKIPKNSWYLVIKMIAFAAIFAMLIVHGRDIVCRHCMSIDEDNAPRFWQYGRALHLVPHDSEAINLAPDALRINR